MSHGTKKSSTEGLERVQGQMFTNAVAEGVERVQGQMFTNAVAKGSVFFT